MVPGVVVYALACLFYAAFGIELVLIADWLMHGIYDPQPAGLSDREQKRLGLIGLFVVTPSPIGVGFLFFIMAAAPFGDGGWRHYQTSSWGLGAIVIGLLLVLPVWCAFRQWQRECLHRWAATAALHQ